MTQGQAYNLVSPLVDEMRAKYPPEFNIEGLEPALTDDIAEIVRILLKSQVEEILELLENSCKGCEEIDFPESILNLGSHSARFSYEVTYKDGHNRSLRDLQQAIRERYL